MLPVPEASSGAVDSGSTDPGAINVGPEHPPDPLSGDRSQRQGSLPAPQGHRQRRATRRGTTRASRTSPRQTRSGLGRTPRTRREASEATALDIPATTDHCDGSGEPGHACPFHRRDPGTYWQCVGFSFVRYADLTQHIRRRHTLGELYCPSCYDEFPSEVPRDQHVREARCCATHPPQDKILPHTYQDLVKKPEGTTSDKWEMAWEILFPGQRIPESTLIYRDIRDAAIALDESSRRLLPLLVNNAHLEVFHYVLAHWKRAIGLQVVIPALIGGPSETWVPVPVVTTSDETQYLIGMQGPDLFIDPTDVDFEMTEGLPIDADPMFADGSDPWAIGNQDSLESLFNVPAAYFDDQNGEAMGEGHEE